MAEENRKEQLSEKQLMAIDLILSGKVDREVAEAVGVSRSTISDWRNGNYLFQAELNKRRREIQEAGRERLRRIRNKALDTVEKAIEEGDVKTALEILRLTGIEKEDLKAVGPEDPEVLRKAEEEQREWSRKLENISKNLRRA